VLEPSRLNRLLHFNDIEDKLNYLAYRIETRGKLNLLDLHIHSESFFLHFCNELYGWKLVNMNAVRQNAEAIDLIDHSGKRVVQVSATATKQKIEDALSKDLSAYQGYTFSFISISKDASSLRGKTFLNPHGLTFDPTTGIHDIPSLLRYIQTLGADDQRRIAEFLKKELVAEVEPMRLESNLAAIINVLAKQDLTVVDADSERTPFNIDNKIDFNDLSGRRELITDLHVYCGKIDRIYSDFDREGSNKSWSVLNTIRNFYSANSDGLKGCGLLDKVIECVAKQVRESINFEAIPIEELEQCVQILVVDAFIRCKIFKNPVGYANASA
jgi:hypothetical protein